MARAERQQTTNGGAPAGQPPCGRHSEGLGCPMCEAEAEAFDDAVEILTEIRDGQSAVLEALGRINAALAESRSGLPVEVDAEPMPALREARGPVEPEAAEPEPYVPHPMVRDIAAVVGARPEVPAVARARV